MYRDRLLLFIGALLLTIGSPGVFAHDDTDGPFSFTAKKVQSGSSGGFYQYEIRWKLKGAEHNDWDIIHLQSAVRNIGPFRTWARTKAHTGNVMPVELARWHRLVAWKQNPIKVLGLYAPRYTEDMWVPAQRCGGGSAAN